VSVPLLLSLLVLEFLGQGLAQSGFFPGVDFMKPFRPKFTEKI
jgi:hypothetical protein